MTESAATGNMLFTVKLIYYFANWRLHIQICRRRDPRQSAAQSCVATVYGRLLLCCRGEQPITFLKALPKALSDS